MINNIFQQNFVKENQNVVYIQQSNSNFKCNSTYIEKLRLNIILIHSPIEQCNNTKE